MKNLENLKEAKLLSKKEQTSIKAGSKECYEFYDCPRGYVCELGKCVPGTP